MPASSRRPRVLLVSLVLLTLATAACATRTVGQVLADPGEYRNREVTLEGAVIESYSLLGRGLYRLDDGTGDLWVYATEGVPREGARVRARGTIRDGFSLGSIEGIIALPDAVRTRLAAGVLMVESDRQAR